MKDFSKLDPAQYLKIIWRRRWYVLAGFVLVSAGAAVYAFRMPNIYKSEAKILIEEAPISQDYVRPSDRSSPEEQVSAIREQIQSRSFLERMVQDFQLFGYGKDPKFSMDSAVAATGKSVQVVSTSRNVFSISYSASEAPFAQNFLKRLVDTLIQSGNSSRKTRAVETDQFLDDQLSQTEKNLTAQEDKIKKFKMSHLGELPEQSAANMNALSGLNAQLAAVENSLQHARDQQKLLDFRAQEQKRLGVLTRSLMTPAPQSAGSEKEVKRTAPPNPLLAAKQAELAATLSKYTPNHPDVIRLSREIEDLKGQSEAKLPPELNAMSEPEKKSAAGQVAEFGLGADTMLDIEAAEIKVEAEGIKNEIAKREKEKEAILAQIKTYQGRLNLAPALDQEFMALSREHEALKQQYASLTGKKFQAQMTSDAEKNKNSDTYRIIDEANLPERPSFPNRMQIVLMGLGAGLVVGIGAAFGRELLDTTLGSEEEVAAVLKLPVLVTVSEIPGIKNQKRMRLLGLGKSA